jgi:hypothetical protein
MRDQGWHTRRVIESGEAGPRFAVLAVVASTRPGEEGRLGVVARIRRYVDGEYKYEIGPLDAHDEIVGGVYAERDLAPNDHPPVDREHFWTGELRPREVVQVSRTHPKPRLHGLFGVVRDQTEDGGYGIEFTDVFRGKNRHRTIAGRHLRQTGDRLPPAPAPRPVITYRPGRDDRNDRPTYEFDILDEVDQYL